MKRTTELAIEWIILLVGTNLASFGIGLFVFATGFAPLEVIMDANAGIIVAVVIGVVFAAVWTARLVKETSERLVQLESLENS